MPLAAAAPRNARPTVRTSAAAAQVPPSHKPISTSEPWELWSAPPISERDRNSRPATETPAPRVSRLVNRRWAMACGGDRQDPDTARRHALHQRQRRQRQGRHVHDEAARLHREARQPRARGKQQAKRLHGAAQRQPRQLGDRRVLAQVGQAHERRGGERQHERDSRPGMGARHHSEGLHPPTEHAFGSARGAPSCRRGQAGAKARPRERRFLQPGCVFARP